MTMPERLGLLSFKTGNLVTYYLLHTSSEYAKSKRSLCFALTALPAFFICSLVSFIFYSLSLSLSHLLTHSLTYSLSLLKLSFDISQLTKGQTIVAENNRTFHCANSR